MVLVQSTMMPLGSQTPAFTLPDVTSGKIVSLETFQEKKALLVMFICKHCPYVIHVEAELAKLGEDYKDSNLGIVAISANDIENYPQDAPEELRKQAKRLGFTFPYLFDSDQRVAHIFTASCTPDFFLFDANRKLAYRGQLDDSRPGNNVQVSGRDLRAAIDEVLKGLPASGVQKPSIGCNIKWKPGNEPKYFLPG